MKLKECLADLGKLRNPEKAKILSGFFKTGKGEYGEGDVFWGIIVPEQRIVAKKYAKLELDDVETMLLSPVHEHRLVALLILVEKYEKADEKEREIIVELYLKNTKWINNWDLVDLSAPKIIGAHYLGRDKKILYRLSKSKNLWEKRIAIVSTSFFIKNKKLDDTFKIAEILLNDKNDLIHKAVGWMLREAGKIDEKKEEIFLEKYRKEMPRTMLRYAIERFPEKKRRYFLGK